jgi:hypothetical protein
MVSGWVGRANDVVIDIDIDRLHVISFPSYEHSVHTIYCAGMESAAILSRKKSRSNKGPPMVYLTNMLLRATTLS